MKKLARVFGILGGLGAMAYVMRDRLISLTAPREPELPKFRPMPSVPPADPADAPRSAGADDLTQIKGIGPVYAKRLGEEGIASFEDLVARGPTAIADLLELAESHVAEWIDQARQRTR